MNYQVTKPRPKETGDNSTADNPLTWTVSPVRGNGKGPKPEWPGVEELQKLGAIPPTIVVNGLRVVEKQKIVILSRKEIDDLKTVRISGENVPVEVLRVSDCPNPVGEYGKANGPLNFMVLVRFNKLTVKEIALGRIEGAGAESAQANNFLLNDNPPPRKPSPPIDDDDMVDALANSDFQITDPKDISQYPEKSQTVVAVLDSGAKFDLANRPNTSLYEYTDRKGNLRKLGLVRGKATCGSNGNSIGYCGVGTYLMPPHPLPITLSVLLGLSARQICDSAFDDTSGRHGTQVTAIINQESGDGIGVLPVKAFNWAGFAQLYDILVTLNYVLEQKKNGVPILVLNASWSGLVDDDGRALLFSKFRELEKAGIIVVAAAGNQGVDLGGSASRQLYPALFSTDLSNIITVTSVEPVMRIKALDPLGGVADHVAEAIAGDGKENILDHLGLNSALFSLLIRGYKAVGNYSKVYVSMGVFGRRWHGYNSPFHRNTPLNARTSFAAAFASGQIAKYLQDRGITPTGATVGAVRDAIIRDLTQRERSLDRTIKGGRLLTVNE